MTIDCKSVRDQLHAESLACISPYPSENLAYKVNKWVTYRGTLIHCDFFERELGWEFYIYRNRFYIIHEKSTIFKNFDGCGINECDIVLLLGKRSTEVMMFLYSLFSKMCQSVRAAAAGHAAYIASGAAYIAAVAADAAADAAAAAGHAAYIASVAANAAADSAYDTYNAAIAADAAAVAHDVATARIHSRKAFKELMVFRKRMKEAIF